MVSITNFGHFSPGAFGESGVVTVLDASIPGSLRSGMVYWAEIEYRVGFFGPGKPASVPIYDEMSF